jgi:Kef-type K+ transport system membrane component KefB
MQPLAAILLALAAVIVTGQILARVLARFGQPAVIAEVLAGILLGPSLLGPEISAYILPPPIAPALRAIAYAGVIAYMFLVGVELEMDHVRARGRATLAIAFAAVVVPFAAGALLAVTALLPLAPAGVTATTFTLFMGIAMAVTAFPVLARILRDRGLDRTPMGVVALSAAAAGDVVTWLLLAAIVGLTNVHASSLWIVGAFLAGVMVPTHSAVGRAFGPRVIRIVSVVLLPAFFAFTGMRTRIDLLEWGSAWMICALIIAVAVVGKMLGALAGARMGRLPWADAKVIAVLMNTRGLMELVVLNIGLELGIISPPLFAMMVLMALVTTMMTGPLLKVMGR